MTIFPGGRTVPRDHHNRTTMSMEYHTHDGNEVPTKVTNAFDTTPWNDTSDHIDPENIWLEQTHHGNMWVGQVDGSRQFVSDRGNATPHHHFDHVQQMDSGVAQPFIGEPIYYGDDVTVVHHDHYKEHVTRIIVVTAPNEHITLCSRSGVVWNEPQQSPLQPVDLSKDSSALKLASSLVDAQTGVDVPNKFKRALNGWHSSIEKSEQAELINALSSGDVPPEWSDEGSIFPYAVKFGDTNNVCTVNASVYGIEQFTDAVKDIFKGTRAQPGHSGFN